MAIKSPNISQNSIISNLEKNLIDVTSLDDSTKGDYIYILKMNSYNNDDICKLLNINLTKLYKLYNKKIKKTIDKNIYEIYTNQISELMEIKKKLHKAFPTNPTGCADKILKVNEQIQKLTGLDRIAETNLNDASNPLALHLISMNTTDKKDLDKLREIQMQIASEKLKSIKGEVIPANEVNKQINQLMIGLEKARDELIKIYGIDAGKILENCILNCEQQSTLLEIQDKSNNE